MQLCNLLHFFRRSLYNIFKILISLTHLNFPLLRRRRLSLIEWQQLARAYTQKDE